MREADGPDYEFLAALVHELRNPLAALTAASHLLARAEQRPEIASMARDALHRQVADMSRLLDDVLEVERLRRGELTLRTERVSVCDRIQEAIETVQPLLETRHHELHVDLPRQPLYVEAEPARLTQIVAKLLSNAAKQTEPGGQISVQARSEAREAVIAVRDTGPGIDPQILPEIFEGRGRGLRIELALVHGLVGLHAGTVTAESAGPRLGSAFVVRLPLVD